jgi:large subunit ribosomal protein L6
LNLKLGYSHEVHIEVGPELEIVCPNQTTIFIKGVDLEKVTQKAAEIRSWRLPEPYKGKGIFYKNETIRRKEGKKN